MKQRLKEHGGKLHFIAEYANALKGNNYELCEGERDKETTTYFISSHERGIREKNKSDKDQREHANRR